MKKIFLILALLTVILAGTVSHGQSLKTPRPVIYSTQTDTGKSKDSLAAKSAVYIYPCGIGKFITAMITNLDGLAGDSLIFVQKNIQGKSDTLGFKIWKAKDDSVRTTLVIPTSGSISIMFWQPYIDYEIICYYKNQTWNILRKWLINWVVQSGM